MAEDANIPYVFVPSKEELGHASATKRPTSCVMVCPDQKKKPKKKDGDDDKDDDDYVDDNEGKTAEMVSAFSLRPVYTCIYLDT